MGVCEVFEWMIEVLLTTTTSDIMKSKSQRKREAKKARRTGTRAERKLATKRRNFMKEANEIDKIIASPGSAFKNKSIIKKAIKKVEMKKRDKLLAKSVTRQKLREFKHLRQKIQEFL